MAYNREHLTELKRIERELLRRVYNNNPKKWINDNCFIRLEGGGKGLFKLRDYQEEFIDLVMANKKVCVLKARQMGFSWVNAALALWFALYHEESDILIMSKSEDAAIKQLKRIKFMLKHLPKEHQLRVQNDSATVLTLDNGTNIYSLTAGQDSGRGDTAIFALWDEAAISRFSEDIRASLEPAAEKGHFVVQSTPKGIGGTFHEIWGDEYFTKMICDWRRHPDRDEAWAIRNGWMSEDIHKRRIFNQEYGCSFTGSAENVFDVDVIEDMMTRCINPISSNNGLKIFEEPVQGEKYAIGADTAQGVIKGDYSAAVVLRKSTNTVVATFHKRIPIEQYSKILFDLSIKYNKALIGVESNNHGHAVLQYLKNYGANLYHQKTYDNYNKKWTTRIGWNTNGKTKPIMINELADNIRNYNITVLDKEILEEMTKFVFVEVGKSEKMEASKGYHDDYTMSLAICQQILKDVILFHKPTYKQVDTIEQYLKKKYRSSIDSVYEKTGYY